MSIYLRRTAFVFLFCFPIICIAQSRVNENSFIPVVDEPLVYNQKMIEAGFRKILIYRCSDSVFTKQGCRLVQKGHFNDSGQLVQITSGKSIENGQVSFVTNFQKISDTLYTAKTIFSPSYIRENAYAFVYDTVIEGKSKRLALYPLEKDSSIQVTAKLFFSDGSEEASKIQRYDRSGKLRETSYPMGNRKELRRYSDTVIENGESTIKLNVYYAENSFHSFAKYNAEKKIVENGYSNFTYGTQPSGQKTMFVYGYDGKLIFAHTVDQNNAFMYTQSYRYNNGVRTEYLKMMRPSDSLEYNKEVYNSDGTVKATYNIQSLDRRSEDVSFYRYVNGLKSRRDDYFNNKYLGSTLYVYE